MNLFYFKIPVGYKNLKNCLIKIILSRTYFWRGGAVAAY